MPTAPARRAAALALIALVAWLSLKPTPPIQPEEGGLLALIARPDLPAHAAAHAAAAGAVAFAWPLSVARPVAWSFGLWAEAGQAQAVNREFSLLDLAANLAGVALGLATGAAARRRFGPG